MNGEKLAQVSVEIIRKSRAWTPIDNQIHPELLIAVMRLVGDFAVNELLDDYQQEPLPTDDKFELEPLNMGDDDDSDSQAIVIIDENSAHIECD